MQPEASRHKAPSSSEQAGIINCSQCHAAMPREMRFCRACGFRLGEGVAEYVETVRFQSQTAANKAANTTTPTPNASTQSRKKSSCASIWGDWSAMARNLAQQSVCHAKAPLAPSAPWGIQRKHHSRGWWIMWALISIMALAIAGGGMIASFTRRSGDRIERAGPAPRSYFGSDFKTADGGAFIEYITPPGSAADKAGLLGGDVIISFDGQPVKSEADIIRLLRQTPVGKTVDVVFIRDGQSKTVKLTTISGEENSRLKELADDRPEGEGYIGIGRDLDRAIVPGLNIYGVRLNRIEPNNPADIAGLRNGDILIEFNGIPTRTGQELVSRIERAMPGSIAKVVVIRGNERVEIPVKIGRH